MYYIYIILILKYYSFYYNINIINGLPDKLSTH